MRANVFRSLAVVCLAALTAPSYAAPSVAAADKPRGGGPFEDRPEPFVAAHPRTEAEEDRLEAAAKFAAGRTLEQRDESAAALQLYERAVRLDPQATPVLRELVPLAYNLDRRAEALRYAVKLVEQDDSDPALLRRIGLFVAQEGDWKRGAKLLEKALNAEEAEPKPTAAQTEIRVELGRIDFLLARYDEAARLFDKVLPALDKPKDFGLTADERRTLIGDDGLTFELMAAAYLETNRPQQAALAFEQLDKLAPNAATRALNAARVAEKSSHPADALKQLDVYFASHPAEVSTASLELLKTVLKEFNQSGQLVERLKKLHRALPASIPIDFFLAEQLRRSGKLAEARPLYEATIKKSPTAEAYLRWSRSTVRPINPRRCCNCWATSSKTAAVSKCWTKTSSRSPATTSWRPGCLPWPARSTARPRRPTARRCAARRLWRPSASNSTLPPSFTSWFSRPGRRTRPRFCSRGDSICFWPTKTPKRPKCFSAASTRPSFPTTSRPSSFIWPVALELQGHTDDALAVVRKMLDQKKPTEARYAERLPWILFHAKRNEAAYKAYRELIARFDDDYSSEQNRQSLREAREALSAVCVALHKPAEAEEWLQQSLDEYPDDVGAQNDLGYLWADQGKHLQRSLAMIGRAVAAEPDNVAYRDSLGWALFRVGRDKQAIVELKKACAGDNPDATILEHLGDVYEHVHQRNDALEQWNLCAQRLRKRQRRRTDQIRPRENREAAIRRASGEVIRRRPRHGAIPQRLARAGEVLSGVGIGRQCRRRGKKQRGPADCAAGPRLVKSTSDFRSKLCSSAGCSEPARSRFVAGEPASGRRAGANQRVSRGDREWPSFWRFPRFAASAAFSAGLAAVRRGVRTGACPRRVPRGLSWKAGLAAPICAGSPLRSHPRSQGQPRRSGFGSTRRHVV